MSSYNQKIQNVLNAFKAIDKDGNVHNYSGEPWVANIVESHVQGVAMYGNYCMLTYNNKGYSKGFVMAVNTNSNSLVLDFDTPDEHYNHPGGIQAIGDFLLVPVENSGADDSYLHFYNMSGMNDNTQPTLLAYSKHRNGNGAGAAGITNFTGSDGVEYYLMCAYDNGATDFYLSNGLPLSDAGIVFQKVASHKFDESGYSSTCLLTDTSNNIYMIGFRVSGSVSYDDYADLYQISMNDNTPTGATKLDSRHFYTDHGKGVSGIAGVHFRWGAGVSNLTSTTFNLLATQRNFVGNNLTINVFNQ